MLKYLFNRNPLNSATAREYTTIQLGYLTNFKITKAKTKWIGDIKLIEVFFTCDEFDCVMSMDVWIENDKLYGEW